MTLCHLSTATTGKSLTAARTADGIKFTCQTETGWHLPVQCYRRRKIWDSAKPYTAKSFFIHETVVYKLYVETHTNANSTLQRDCLLWRGEANGESYRATRRINTTLNHKNVRWDSPEYVIQQ